MPHSGRDKVDYIEALEVVRGTLVKGKRMGAVVFFIGSNLNSELKLCLPADKHRRLDRKDKFCSRQEIEMIPIIEIIQMYCDQHLDEQ